MAQRRTRSAMVPSTSDSLREYGRGLAGGLLFSLPLLYTMEMWWAGFVMQPFRLLTLIAFTFVLLLGYNRFAGLHEDAGWMEVAIDSVEELGLGLVLSSAILFLLGRIGPGEALDEMVGKIVAEASVVAIGFSIGTAQLGGGGEDEVGFHTYKRAELPGQLVIAFCGAVLFASNIAPTEEILQIGVETHPFRLIALMAGSITIGSIILYYTNFTGSREVIHVGGGFDVVVGAAITYAVALVASALMLWFFGRFDGASLEICTRQVVVLALPGSLGASAGRLFLQS